MLWFLEHVRKIRKNIKPEKFHWYKYFLYFYHFIRDELAKFLIEECIDYNSIEKMSNITNVSKPLTIWSNPLIWFWQIARLIKMLSCKFNDFLNLELVYFWNSKWLQIILKYKSIFMMLLFLYFFFPVSTPLM